MIQRKDFLPTQAADMAELGWDACDFVFISGDAYVDHPSFAMALLGRYLQAKGFRVGIIAQPNHNDNRDMLRLGEPRLAWLVGAGNMDSMVNHYTSSKRHRKEDAYSPGGRTGLRPDRATLVYANACKRAANRPVIIGGIEASLRRFAHYDYWQDGVRGSFLNDCSADYLVFGMGEKALLEWAQGARAGWHSARLASIRGMCVMVKPDQVPEDAVVLPSLEEVRTDKRAFAIAHKLAAREQCPVAGKPVAQAHGGRVLLQNPPAKTLSTEELDEIYELPYAYEAHPDYPEGIPAFGEVKFSIANTRGCFGNCSFCALSFHQGRQIVCRSHESVLRQAKLLTTLPGFAGYINDVGGPTANFTAPSCAKAREHGVCPNKNCCGNKKCDKLMVSHRELIILLRKLRALPGVKKVFVRSGLRFDYIMYDKEQTFLNELVREHVSGQLKVAPEHVSDKVLRLMGKPSRELWDKFCDRFYKSTRMAHKEQYLVPYLMSGHPGSDMEAAIELASYLRQHNIRPEQVQDFYPTPGTRSTVMWYTGLDPLTLQEVYVPRDPREKAMQRALLQATLPYNQAPVRAALREAGREDLIGYDKNCIVPPERGTPVPRRDAPKGRAPRGGYNKPKGKRR